MYGVDSAAALDAQAFLAHVAGWGQGLWYVAEPLLVSVVALRGESLGPAHPSSQAAAAYYLDLLLRHNRCGGGRGGVRSRGGTECTIAARIGQEHRSDHRRLLYRIPPRKKGPETG